MSSSCECAFERERLPPERPRRVSGKRKTNEDEDDDARPIVAPTAPSSITIFVGNRYRWWKRARDGIAESERDQRHSARHYHGRERTTIVGDANGLDHRRRYLGR